MKKVVCPHCGHEFNRSDALVKPAKDHYNWYEISETQTFCPSCNGRYQADISVLGAVLFCTFTAVCFLVSFVWKSDYSVMFMLLALCALIIIPARFFRVEAKPK